MTSLLLERQANVDAVDHKHETSLSVAASLLMKRGGFGAVEHGDEQAARFHGVVSLLMENGGMVLYSSARNNNIEVATLLLDNDAERYVDEKEAKGGQTSLHLTASFKFQDMAALLLDSGAHFIQQTMRMRPHFWWLQARVIVT